MTRYDRRV